MALVDQWGEPFIQHRPARGADRNTGARPYEPVEFKDIGQLVPSYDRKVLLSASRKLYLNDDVVKGAIEQRSTYAVGSAWLPVFTGTDAEYGKRATEWLLGEWYPLCDIRGSDYDFTSILYNTSNGIDRDGETWELLTKDRTDYPRIQQIPAHRIGSPYGWNETRVTEGLYRNAKVVDGIAYNRLGQPVAVAYLDETGKFNQWISARDIIHNFDPSWQEQGRGLPVTTGSLNALRDAMQSHEWERHALLMMSAIGLIEKNETGGPDVGDPMTTLTGACEGTPAGDGVTLQNFAGGMVKYFKANSGAGLETLKNDRPGTSWEAFMDRIYRVFFAGMGWSYSLAWKPTGQGTAERNDIGKAQRSIEDRQELLKKGARRKVGYAVSKAAKLGILPEHPEWWKWDFTTPQKLTIDDGRTLKEDIEGWRAGFRNMSDILGAYGKTMESHLRDRAEGIALSKKIAKEVSEKYGVEIKDEEMSMLTPNGNPQQKENDANDPTDD